MSFRILLFSWMLTLLLLSATSCGNNPKPEENLQTEHLDDTIAVSQSSADTSVNSSPDDSTGIQADTKKDRIPDAPPPNYSSLPGPVGFVNEDNLVMRDKPNSKSNKIATLKMKEAIYIIETSMIGDDDKQTEYPTWYRIQRQNKERGWVKASAISSGH